MKVVKFEKVGSSWKAVKSSDKEPNVNKKVEVRREAPAPAPAPASKTVLQPKHGKTNSMVALAMRRASSTDDWEEDMEEEEEEEEVAENCDAEDEGEWEEEWEGWEGDTEPAPKRAKTSTADTYPGWKPPPKIRLDLSQTFSGVVNKRVAATGDLLIECEPVTQTFKRPAIIPADDNRMSARVGSCVVFKVSQRSDDGVPIANDVVINGFEEIEGAETISWEEDLVEAEKARIATAEEAKAQRAKGKTKGSGKSKTSNKGKVFHGNPNTNYSLGKSKPTVPFVSNGFSGKSKPHNAWTSRANEQKVGGNIAPWKSKQHQGSNGIAQGASGKGTGKGKGSDKGLSPAAAALAKRLAASKGHSKG